MKLTGMKLAAAFFALAFMVSCRGGGGSSSSSSNISEKSRVLQIRMHDLPISGFDVEKAVVEIREIQVHHAENGWITVSTEAKSYDLLELQHGVSALIFERPLELGKYTQIRLVLNQNNEVFVKGRPYRLKIPSGQTTGIKLITPFEITEGKMVEITLDFNAQQSVTLTKGQGFLLKPVIKVEKVIEYDAVGIVSAEGGNVTSFDGAVNIQVPTGAVSDNIRVSVAETDVSGLPTPDERSQLIGKAYNLEPDGQTFSSDVWLIFKYDQEEVAAKGSEQNLAVYRYDEITDNWMKISSLVAPYANTVFAKVNHFSLYAVFNTASCYDGVQNFDEAGIDCGGSCPAECINCNGYDYGSAASSNLYSFGDPSVMNAANEALAEYASYKGVDVSTLDTPEEKMEAVAYYVHRYMAYMVDVGSWSGAQSAAKTIKDSPNRFGTVHIGFDGDNPIYEDRTCTGSPTYGAVEISGVKEKIAKFCGDCEDFAILRASLMRHLGVAQQCIMNADYHYDWDHPADTPSAYADPYDYETANDLFLPASSDGKKSHTFNIVIYRNKYRFMDYAELGKRYFWSYDDWDSHRADNIWNDHIGQWWSGLRMLPRPVSESYMHNWPGQTNANKCYELGKSYWTHKTLYSDICP